MSHNKKRWYVVAVKIFSILIPFLQNCFSVFGDFVGLVLNSLATIMVVNDHMKHYVIERQFTGFLCGKKL